MFSGGIAKLVQQIDEQGLDNIRLFTDDALKLLVKLPDASLDEAYLLYPDPWPKTRHHKRRFVSPTTLAELARVLRPGARLPLRHRYRGLRQLDAGARPALARTSSSPRPRPGAWHQPYPGWEPTRYEEKARLEGRLRSFYFTFIRR